jgi:NAD(P)-dependent dehydrogenase (short-subunit alcohol dehydrogenase family)
MPNHHGKIALVTGANQGIGLETARQLAELGFTVLMGCRDLQKGTAALQQIQKPELELQLIQLDTTSPSDRQAAFEKIEQNFGRLDVLINNAGIALDKHSIPSQVSEELIRRTFDTNFFSVVSLTQLLLPLIQKSSAGRIVNLSSNLGSLTEHSDSNSSVYTTKLLAYDSSKTALNAFTVHLAYELRHSKIKINSAHPGWVRTNMGGSMAPMNIADGAKTSVLLATLPEDGPTGGFFHLNESIPW